MDNNKGNSKDKGSSKDKDNNILVLADFLLSLQK